MGKRKPEKRGLSIVRVSSARQRDNISHEVQEKEIESYAAEQGLRLVRTVRIVESAKDSSHRRQYAEALNWALSNGVEHICFYMYDREARNLTDNEANEKLVRAGLITLHYARDRKSIDRFSPDSDFFMRDMNALLNKNFCRNLSAKVSDAFRTKAENGWFPHNKIHLGYVHQKLRDDQGRELKRGTIIVRDPNGKNVRQVQREFELRGHERLSYEEIRRQIIAEGFIAPGRISKYRVCDIERRIKSLFYRGRFEYGGKQYEGRHERIISDALIAAVDETIGLRGKAVQANGVFGGGWLTCTECGCHVVYDPKTKIIKRTGKRVEYRYYHCSNGRRMHDTLRGYNATEDSIWAQFGHALDKISITESFAAAVAKAMNETHEAVRRQRRKEADDYRLSLSALERAEDEAYRDMKAGLLDESAYLRHVERIRGERRSFTALLEAENEALDGAYLETANSILELARSAKSLWFTRTPEERREFLERVLSNRSLEGLIVRYELKKPFAALSEMKGREDWRPQLDNFRTAILSLAA